MLMHLMKQSFEKYFSLFYFYPKLLLNIRFLERGVLWKTHFRRSAVWLITFEMVVKICIPKRGF